VIGAAWWSAVDASELECLNVAYRRDGFVAVPGLLGGAEVEALRTEIVAIARGRRGPVAGTTSRADMSDEDVIGNILALHMPHKISPLMREAMSLPRIVEIVKALVSPNLKSMQTMLFVKKAGKPGQAWHQDEHYIATRDRSLCGVWIALDDATIENGCMWMHPGSQLPGVLYPVRPHEDARFDSADEAFGHDYKREGGVPIELQAGGVAFFNGYVLHRSLPNNAGSGYRRALVTHYMSAESLLPWTMGADMARPDVRDIVMICGRDPYAWREIEDITRPYLRSESARRD
jgi:phytanoyl-CoA hydroxylase